MKKLLFSVKRAVMKNRPNWLLKFAWAMFLMSALVSSGYAQNRKSNITNPPPQGPVTVPSTGPTIPPVNPPIPPDNLAVQDLSISQEGNNTFISVNFKASTRNAQGSRIPSKFKVLLNGKQIANGNSVVTLNFKVDACKTLECSPTGSDACGCLCPDDLGKWIVDGIIDLTGIGLVKSLFVPSYNNCELVVVKNPEGKEVARWCKCYFHLFVKLGPFPAGTFRPGDQITVFIDSANTVKEYNEGDNKGTIVFNVPQTH